jgi:hypothetical protein
VAVELIKSDGIPDWYALYYYGELWLPCIEGPRDHWVGILRALMARHKTYYKRVACQPQDSGYSMWSPRNAAETWDFLRLSKSETDELIASIHNMFFGGKKHGTSLQNVQGKDS